MAKPGINRLQPNVNETVPWPGRRVGKVRDPSSQGYAPSAVPPAVGHFECKKARRGGGVRTVVRTCIDQRLVSPPSLSLAPFSLYRWDSFPREQIKWHETRPVTRSSGLNVSQPHAILFLLLCSSPYFAEFPRPSTSFRGFMRYLIPIDLTTFPYFVGAVSRFGNLEKSMKFDAGTRGSHRKLETRRLLRGAFYYFISSEKFLRIWIYSGEYFLRDTFYYFVFFRVL